MAKEKVERSPIEQEFDKYFKAKKVNPYCMVCKKDIKEADLGLAAFVKNKRGGEYFVHKDCARSGL